MNPDLAAAGAEAGAGADTIEAVFLIRAFRTTFAAVFGASVPVQTDKDAIVAAVSLPLYKDAPGGQVLGADFRLHASAAGFRAGKGP